MTPRSVADAPRRALAAGFTLVELLVALLILAVIAGMAWQGVDAMLRSRDVAAAQLDRQLRLQTTIAQWEADLEALQDSGVVPALQFDGASLRMTRRTDTGLQLVVWALRGGSWMRWSAVPATRALALQEAWLQSQQLLGNEVGQLRTLQGVEGWQLYFWRGNSWSNAQSSGDQAEPGQAPGASQRQELPAAVRVVLSFAPDSGFAGTLTRDVLLAPQATP
jgi:general secretion pathway protein J